MKHIEQAAQTRLQMADQIDTVTVDIPLLIRLLEHAREDVKSDAQLHEVVTRIIKQSKVNAVLTMDHYDSVAAIKQIAAAKPPDSPLSAIEWLAAYIEQSWGIPIKYKRPAVVVPLLNTLKKVVPYVPVEKPLYRVLGSNKPLKVGAEINLPADLVTSFTTLKSKASLIDLADQVGASGSKYAYVVQPTSKVIEVCNTPWAVTKALRYGKKAYPDSREVSFLEGQYGYKWQQEVMAYSKTPIKCKVLMDISQ